MKTFKKAAVVLVGLLLPTSAAAFLGIGDSGDLILTKMLAELIVHTQTLKDMLLGVDYLNTLQTDVRRGIDDPLLLTNLGLPDREAFINEMMQTDEFREVPILGAMTSVHDLKSAVDNTWGTLPKSANELKQLATKDLQAIYSISHAAAIQDEGRSFFQTGSNLLDDLEGSHESKAALRNAQASALQVQQLGQIEANQGLQIALGAQEALSQNEKQKGIQQFNEAYLGMLQDGFASLKPMGPR
ncbi:MAG TPA: hypothetical protein VFX30_12230 [bacterium]|nr:hypothetical protein [bacterium]